MPLDPDQVRRRQAGLQRRARTVRWAKWLVPVAAVLAIAALLLAGRDRSGLVEVFTPEELARLGAGLRLESPRLAGTTERGRAYELTASAAVPEGPAAEEIALEAPRGWIETGERRLEGVAERAHLDREEGSLELSGGVEVETSDGWTGETARVTVDLDRQSAVGPEPVHLTGPRGTLDAGSFRVEPPEEAEGEPRIWFENGVHVRFTPPADDEAPR